MGKYGNPYPTREDAEAKAAELNASLPDTPILRIVFAVREDPAVQGWNVVQRRK